VSLWSEGKWTQEGISDVKQLGIDRISFSTLNLGLFAVTVDRFALRPFRGWRLSPVDENKAELVVTLSTGSVIKFVISSEGITVPCLTEEPQSCSLVLHVLERKGVFLKPEHRDERTYVGASELSEIAATCDIRRVTPSDGIQNPWTGVRGLTVRPDAYFEPWNEEDRMDEFVDILFDQRHRVRVKSEALHASLHVALKAVEPFQRALEKSEISEHNVKFADNCRQLLMQLGLLMDA
jgi:hypothetical protein